MTVSNWADYWIHTNTRTHSFIQAHTSHEEPCCEATLMTCVGWDNLYSCTLTPAEHWTSHGLQNSWVFPFLPNFLLLSWDFFLNIYIYNGNFLARVSWDQHACFLWYGTVNSVFLQFHLRYFGVFEQTSLSSACWNVSLFWSKTDITRI